MALVQGLPGMLAVTIAINGTAVQCSATSLRLRHAIFSAFEGNVANVVIGIGAGTADTSGNYWKRLRPGDDYEFSATRDACLDLLYFYINNNAGTGHVGDGIVIAKLGFE